MLKLFPVFLVIAIVSGIFSLSATTVIAKVVFFASTMLLIMALIDKKRIAEGA
jgi:uncharacterized membrane protein YtjA (UPF0391 family)